MRLVLLSELFGKGMGYLENMLPKYFARLGVETHVVVTDLQLYAGQKAASVTYQGFSHPLRPGSSETLDGYTLHVLGHRRILGHVRMTGLYSKLRAIGPDVVQTMTNIGWVGMDAALGRCLLGYKLFTGCHYHASVFPLAGKALPLWSAERLECMATRTIPGALASLMTEKCYAISEDCGGIARSFFGVPRGKIEICPLGVDTDLFHTVSGAAAVAERAMLRQRLGFAGQQIICIYTGRFSEDKNPLVLARAVAELCRAGEPYRGLFIGNGTQAREIEKCAGCVTHSFVPVAELPALYRAADIGVWPAQESLSMLDAAACGLPVVANHTMVARERVDGNGAIYRLNDKNDLVRVLRDLKDAGTRRKMGACGARKMAQEFSWEAIAQRRLRDYQTALRASGSAKYAAAARPAEIGEGD